MTPENIADLLEDQFGSDIRAKAADAAHPHVTVSAQRWPEVAAFLRDDPRLRFNLLRCVSGVDLVADNKLAAIYDLHAMHPADDAADDYYRLASEFAIRIEVDRDHPHIPSVAAVWPAAEWHEREAYDLLGIVFDNNPDSVTDQDGTHPRRILCPDDWAGFPLRKDYVFPMEYHGIPGTTEYELTSPRH